MFWAHSQYSHCPQIETILAKEDLTLNELFNQEGLFQELKAPNKNLIDFITRSDMLTELVRLVTEEPPTELELKERYRLANLACEVLTTDTPLINEKLSEHTYLTKLYSFLDSEPPLNPLLASFFARTFSMLICRKHDQNWYSYQYTCLRVLDFLKSQESSLSKLIRHMGTSAIMELTLKLLTQIEGPELQNTLVYLVEQDDLVEKLVDLLHPSVDEDRNHNASNLLVDTIYKIKDDIKTNAADTTNKRRDSHPILDKIQSEYMVRKILDNIFGQEVTESSIIAGVNVLLALICPPPVPAMGRRDICDDNSNGAGAGDPTKNPSFGNGISVESVKHILLAIIQYLPTIHELLLRPPKREPIKLTCGTLDPPLGQARLSLVRLLAVLISTDVAEINQELDQLDTVNLLLDLFFGYRWNNFLHSQVVKCLALDFSKAFELTESADPSDPSNDNWNLVNPLVSNIFIKCHVLDRVITGAQDNAEEQSDGQRRRGYMGHLMSIATGLWKAMQESKTLARWVEENLKEEEWSAWTEWVKTVLTPAMASSSHCLGESHPMFRCAGVSAPSDDILEKNTVIKLKGNYYQVTDIENFYETSNQPPYPLIFHSKGVSFSPRMIRNMLQDDGNTDCEVTIFEQLCSEKKSVWHDLSDSQDFSLDQSNSSDDEDKDEDDNNDVWSSCNSMEPDSDPWNNGGGLDSDDSWADFESASPVSFSDVLQKGSAVDAQVAQISALMDNNDVNLIQSNNRVESMDDRMDEDEEPPQLFEVSPEPGEEMDEGSNEPPPLPSSPPPPLPTSPPPLPSAIPEAPPVAAAQGDVRAPRPIAPPSVPPPPPPAHRVDAARDPITGIEFATVIVKRLLRINSLSEESEPDLLMNPTWSAPTIGSSPVSEPTDDVQSPPPSAAESPPDETPLEATQYPVVVPSPVAAPSPEVLSSTAPSAPEPASSATLPPSEAVISAITNPVMSAAPVLAPSAASMLAPTASPVAIAAASLIAESIPTSMSAPVVTPGSAAAAETCAVSTESTSEQSEVVPSTEVPEVTVPMTDLSNRTEEQNTSQAESTLQPITEGSNKDVENASR